MPVKDNKAMYGRWLDEVWNKKNVDAAVEEFVDPLMADHSLPGVPRDPEMQKLILSSFATAFPDMQLRIDDIIAERDKVVGLLTLVGTHQAEFLGFPPTGKQVWVTMIDVMRIANGKFVEHWVEADFVGLGD